MSQRTLRLTALIERDEDMFVSFCPELEVASQGATIEEAHANLKEALTLFIEEADAAEVDERLRGEMFVTSVEISVA